MIRFNDITSLILKYNPKADIGLVEKAYVFSAKAHQGQTRLSGEPYLSHPLEIAHILAKMRMDVVCIVAGLLHDTIEDAKVPLEDVKRLFGDEVTLIVDGVSKISRIDLKDHRKRQAENIRKMILAMSKDIRVILVKLADRLHNMQTLGYHNLQKQQYIAHETLDVYAPIAGRIGIYWIKSQLEDLCLYYLEPKIYREIKTGIAERRDDRKKFIDETQQIISSQLEGKGITVQIKGRYKHFYSIYRKMMTQNLSVDQVYDKIAFRLIVDTVEECYSVLGHIHSMWKQIPGKFKDYIATPKSNLYQSLHTTVIDSVGERMEIQIRTREMDNVAEEGIAAHWKYKEGGSGNISDNEQFQWLRQFTELQEGISDPEDFFDALKMNFFSEEVFVLTPNGDIKELPLHSTPVDFAYAIHTDIGEKCSGAKVNEKMVPLHYRLKNGDVVKIITSAKQHPSRDWLNFVKTSKARAKINQWLRNQEIEGAIATGKNLIEKSIGEESPEFIKIYKHEDLLDIVKEYSLESLEDLYAQAGFGRISSKQIIGRIKTKLGFKEEERQPVPAERISEYLGHRSMSSGITVGGENNVTVRFANCCSPLPGEDVLGFITRGRGVTVHRRSCSHLKHMSPERLVNVTWVTSEEQHIAKLKIVGINKKGILTEISSVLTKADISILHAEFKITGDQKFIQFFTIEVKNYQQLKDVISSVKRIGNILEVDRIQPNIPKA